MTDLRIECTNCFYIGATATEGECPLCGSKRLITQQLLIPSEENFQGTNA